MKFEAGPEQAGTRLDQFLADRLPTTRSGIQAMNRRGEIRVDGLARKAGYRLRAGDVIELSPAAEPPSAIEAEAIPLVVVHEEPAFAIVEKPAGLVVHPGAGNPRGTLANALMARFPELSAVGGPGRPGIVHRLDRWTSGLMIVARTDTAHVRLARSFQARSVQKAYLAGVHGVVARDRGEIDLNVGRHPTRRTRMAAGAKRGREAYSEYRVLDRAGESSLLEVRIRTGRTHQIRVHLAAIGYPVIGDSVYGEKKNAVFERRHDPIGRYFLHAARLGFPHPESGDWIEFNSPLPEELNRLWEQLAGRER